MLHFSNVKQCSCIEVWIIATINIFLPFIVLIFCKHEQKYKQLSVCYLWKTCFKWSFVLRDIEIKFSYTTLLFLVWWFGFVIIWMYMIWQFKLKYMNLSLRIFILIVLMTRCAILNAQPRSWISATMHS